MSLSRSRPRNTARSPVSTAGTGGACRASEKKRSSSSRDGEPCRDSTQVAWRSTSKSMRLPRDSGQLARRPDEQRDAEPVFEILQCAADGRLRDVELARLRGHVALFREARDHGEASAVQDRREQRANVGGGRNAAARDELGTSVLEFA